MSIVLTFEYKHLFDDVRPDFKTLLQKIPSKLVIGVLATINDTLIIKGTNVATQKFLLEILSINFPQEVRKQVMKRALPLLFNGWELFVTTSTIELINREIIYYRDIEPSHDFGTDELNIFKALMVIGDEIIERDVETQREAIEAAKLGGQNLIKLMWPHLIRQYEFTNKTDFIYETYKGMAFISFIEKHKKFGEFAKAYFKSLNCKSGQEYIHKLVAVVMPHLKRVDSSNPMDYFFRLKVNEPEPVLENLVIDPKEVQNNPDKQLDYLGLKEKPLFKFTSNEYIVPHWNYLYNAFFNGLVFSFYNNSGIKSIYEKNIDSIDASKNEGIANFKAAIGKEFSENILFKNTAQKCFSRKYDTLKFFDDNSVFNPDCYYRHGKHIFIIEFKDYLLNSKVIQSGSYETIKDEIEKKFVSHTIEANGKTKVKEKGVYQLARNIELLNADQALFWNIDEKAKNSSLKLRNMTIHPIIVQTSMYFDFPGINDYLNEKIQERLNPIRNNFRKIAPFTNIHFDCFINRLLLFSDSKIELHNELEHYRNIISKQKEKAQRTMETNEWFQTMIPFSYVSSEEYRKHFLYRRKEVLHTLRKCWNIEEN